MAHSCFNTNDMDPVSKQAQNSVNTPKRRGFGRPFPKGVSGNPGGRPRKKPVTEICEKIFRKSKNRKEVERVIMSIISGGRMSSVLMLKEVAERLEGKVSQEVELSGEVSLGLAETIQNRRKRVANDDRES